MKEKRALIFVAILLIICFIATTCLAGMWLDENVELTIEKKHYVKRQLVEKPNIVYVPVNEVQVVREYNTAEKVRVIHTTSVYPENWDRQDALDRVNQLVDSNEQRLWG